MRCNTTAGESGSPTAMPGGIFFQAHGGVSSALAWGLNVPKMAMAMATVSTARRIAYDGVPPKKCRVRGLPGHMGWPVWLLDIGCKAET